jgi:hypothetical protein
MKNQNSTAAMLQNLLSGHRNMGKNTSVGISLGQWQSVVASLILNRVKAGAVAALLALSFSSFAQAPITIYTDEAQWQAAVGAYSEETFEEFTASQQISYLASLDINFDTLVGTTYPAIYNQYCGGDVFGSFTLMNFGYPCNVSVRGNLNIRPASGDLIFSVGYWNSGGNDSTSLEFFDDNDQSLGSAGAGFGFKFIGIISTVGAKRVEIAEVGGNGVFSIDNLQIGDLRTADSDGDGVNDGADNCPDTANTDQANNDGDAFGDACDLCPTDPQDQDLDGDGICDVDPLDLCVGDDATGDSDGDQICDDMDVCAGNDATGDTDSDLVCDGRDNCPSDANPFQEDFDGDQLGDVCDADNDGDGTNDDVDNCPDLFNPDQANSDDDGLGDACDPDDDNDGVNDDVDNCPIIANPGQENFDGDDDGDACDGDDDADGVADGADLCPATPMGVAFGDDGCSGQQSIDLACESNDPCGFSNHGKYQSCVVHAANAARNDGLLTNKERAAIVRAAAKTHCGD